MKRMVVLLAGVCSLASFGDGLPTNEEIGEIFQTSANYKQIDERLYSAGTNLFFSRSSYPPSEVTRYCYCLMTNLVARRLTTNVDIRIEWSPKMWLFKGLFKSKEIDSDINSLNYCADYINTIRPLSTNDYVTEFWQAHAATNLPAFRARWKMIWRYNSKIEMYRPAVLDDFWYPVAHYISTLPEEEVPAFKTNIVMRAGLSHEEAEDLFNPEDPRFRTTIPIPPEFCAWPTNATSSTN